MVSYDKLIIFPSDRIISYGADFVNSQIVQKYFVSLIIGDKLVELIVKLIEPFLDAALVGSVVRSQAFRLSA